ncbi:acyl carrier protein [Pendulispora rubella]|uniref:Acyl carrier protein n=1 Tax=Pendulispora rubella TaxID=2741070 RepID=A0ABZ2LHR7_9BACT
MSSENQEKFERWVIGVCQGLGVRIKDASSDFFEAGGSSLAAVKLIARVEEEFGEDALPPEDLFSQSAVRDIASCILRNAPRAAAPSDA